MSVKPEAFYDYRICLRNLRTISFLFWPLKNRGA